MQKLLLCLLLCQLPLPLAAQEVKSGLALDEDAAQALARKSDCFKCHAVNKRKKAPSYMEIAAKYRGNPQAAEILYKHLSEGPLVKLIGADEIHLGPATKERAETDNLIRWILSR